MDACVSKAVPCHAIRSDVKLIGNCLALQSPGQIWPDYLLERSQYSQMVTGKKIIGCFRHQGRNTNIVPSLGVLCNEHVVSPKPESLDFVPGRPLHS